MCDADRDGDGVPQFDVETEVSDNCPITPNFNQQDTHEDGVGNACDSTPNGGDTDGDTFGDAIDNCPSVPNLNQIDTDGDDIGNACDSTPNGDDDNDGVDNNSDNCPMVSNTNQTDTDDDNIGDACDSTPNGDFDEDGVDNNSDNCRVISNSNQTDTDGDLVGDACDSTPNGDDDNDGIDNNTDNCPMVSNANQTDSDSDGFGDACDSTPNGDTDNNGDIGDINGQVSLAAEALDNIIAGTRGRTSRILMFSNRKLDQALLANRWESDNQLSKVRGIQVFTSVASALNNIEKIADARATDSALKAELDVVSNSLLDNLRVLAEAKIGDAVAADGSARRIGRANTLLKRADIERSRDSLRSAAVRYGIAWRIASFAF